MWFKRKTKEEKQIELQNELTHLQEKYKDVIKSYCMIGSYVFILYGFVIEDNKIYVKYSDSETPENLVGLEFIDVWDLKYGDTDFRKYRMNFIQFRDKLNRLGVDLIKK